MKAFSFLLALTGLWLAGCTAATTPPPPLASPTSQPLVTATLPPLATAYRSPTPAPPTATPTPQPYPGQTLAPVNIRPNPSLLGEPLGLLPAGSAVEVIGKTAAEDWYRILYPEAAEGSGWVSAQYIRLADPAQVPVIEETPPPADGNLGALTQQLNVRSGPGVAYEVLGILPPGSNITLLGITEDENWYKIAYAEAPDGFGWVYAPYVETQATDLPVFVTSPDGTTTPVPASPTPTPQPAAEDGDTPESPLVGFSLSAEQRSIQFSDDLSAPQGDATDTIQFVVTLPIAEPTTVLIRLECNGPAPEIRLSPLPLAEPLTCDQPFRALDILPNRPYLLTLSRTAPADAPVSYTQYTLYLSLP